MEILVTSTSRRSFFSIVSILWIAGMWFPIHPCIVIGIPSQYPRYLICQSLRCVGDIPASRNPRQQEELGGNRKRSIQLPPLLKLPHTKVGANNSPEKLYSIYGAPPGGRQSDVLCIWGSFIGKIIRSSDNRLAFWYQIWNLTRVVTLISGFDVLAGTYRVRAFVLCNTESQWCRAEESESTRVFSC